MLKHAIILSVAVICAYAGSIEDYIPLRMPCDPSKQNNGVVTKENTGKVCFPGSECNNSTLICDCGDSDDGKWRRTWEDEQCKLLPESTCVNGVNQDFYRCVTNSKCVQTRVGKDNPRNCLADAPCDLGDYNCKCEEGKTCLTQVVPAPKLEPVVPTAAAYRYNVEEYLLLRMPCDPAVQNNGVLTKENTGKVCSVGSKCNNETLICDCSDSDDGNWTRTWEDGQCKLLPESQCVSRVNQDFYRCVTNSSCVQTRVGKDKREDCQLDAPCDLGDYNCKCDEGKTCLTTVVPAPKLDN